MAREKVADLGEDAGVEEIQAAAMETGRTVAQQYEEAEEAERRARRRDTEQRNREFLVGLGVAHVSGYLRQLEREEEFEFEDRERLARKLEKQIRPRLAKEMETDPDADYRDVEERVEELVEEFLPEFEDED